MNYEDQLMAKVASARLTPGGILGGQAAQGVATAPFFPSLEDGLTSTRQLALELNEIVSNLRSRVFGPWPEAPSNTFAQSPVPPALADGALERVHLINATLRDALAVAQLINNRL